MNIGTENSFMRKTAIANFAIVLLLISNPSLTFAIQRSDDWIKYNSKEGRYNVLLPGQPILDSQEATSANGEKFTQYQATVSSGKTIYMIGYFDYPPSTVFAFDTARDRMMDGVKATLLSERSISLGGAPGREIKLLTKILDEDYVVIARFYDANQRVYVIQFIAPKSDETGLDERVARYFDSFQLVKTSQ
jgi:hypothetical protein